MSGTEQLFHPSLLTSIPVTGGAIARRVNEHARHASRRDVSAETDVTVVVRARREAAELERLLEDVHRQQFAGEVQIIVVDNDSNDATPAVARQHGAAVVNIPRDEFTYPRSMNVGMEAADHPFVFLTVGHARLAHAHTLQAGAHHLEDMTAGGVYGITLPGEAASRTDRLVATGTQLYLGDAHRVRKAGLGVLAATNMMIAKNLWHELGGFDERYEYGGEDTLLAGRMIDDGWGVINDPALAVHHSHGLGPVNSVRQLRHWLATLEGPLPFDAEHLAARRPDLDLSDKP